MKKQITNVVSRLSFLLIFAFIAFAPNFANAAQIQTDETFTATSANTDLVFVAPYTGTLNVYTTATTQIANKLTKTFLYTDEGHTGNVQPINWPKWGDNDAYYYFIFNVVEGTNYYFFYNSTTPVEFTFKMVPPTSYLPEPTIISPADIEFVSGVEYVEFFWENPVSVNEDIDYIWYDCYSLDGSSSDDGKILTKNVIIEGNIVKIPMTSAFEACGPGHYVVYLDEGMFISTDGAINEEQEIEYTQLKQMAPESIETNGEITTISWPSEIVQIMENEIGEAYIQNNNGEQIQTLQYGNGGQIYIKGKQLIVDLNGLNLPAGALTVVIPKDFFLLDMSKSSYQPDYALNGQIEFNIGEESAEGIQLNVPFTADSSYTNVFVSPFTGLLTVYTNTTTQVANKRTKTFLYTDADHKGNIQPDNWGEWGDDDYGYYQFNVEQGTTYYFWCNEAPGPVEFTFKKEAQPLGEVQIISPASEYVSSLSYIEFTWDQPVIKGDVDVIPVEWYSLLGDNGLDDEISMSEVIIEDNIVKIPVESLMEEGGPGHYIFYIYDNAFISESGDYSDYFEIKFDLLSQIESSSLVTEGDVTTISWPTAYSKVMLNSDAICGKIVDSNGSVVVELPFGTQGEAPIYISGTNVVVDLSNVEYSGDDLQVVIPENSFVIGQFNSLYYVYINSLNTEITFAVDGNGGKVPGLEYTILTDTTAEVAIGNYSELTDVEIPDTVEINGNVYNVTSIAYRAFVDCTNLETVTFGSNLTTIGAYAFEGCTGLTEVVVPENVTSIGQRAFGSCSNLKSVVLPNNLTILNEQTFAFCENLESVNIPTNLKTLANSVFSYCSSLDNIEFPETLTSIGNQVFQCCSSLSSIVIPNKVKTIGYGVFLSCSSLSSVTIGSNVEEIGFRTFDGCSSLTSIIIPDSLEELGNMAFQNCTSLKEVIFGEGIYDLNKGMFNNCPALETVELPAYLETIGEEAFKDCTSLVTITLPETVESIRDFAFAGCTALSNIYSANLVPPTIMETTFDEATEANATLFVSTEAVEAYETAEYWENFSNIKVEGSTAIENIQDLKDVNVVYTLDGRVIRLNNSNELNKLSKGIYIINGKKVVVK